MEVTCRDCGAVLRLNPNLQDVEVHCPRCGSLIPQQTVTEPPRSGLELEPVESPRPRRGWRDRMKDEKEEEKQKKKDEKRKNKEGKKKKPKKQKPIPVYTLWLFLAQSMLVLLAASCLVSMIWKEDWEPPIWSYFAESPPVLLGAAIVFLFFTVLARRLPVLITLLNSLAVLGACAYYFDVNLTIDVSRVLALAVAFLALWLAFQHRRAIR